MPKPPPRVSCASHGPALPTVSARAAAASNRRPHGDGPRNQWAAEVGIQIDSSAISSDKPEGGAVAADLPAAAAVGAGADSSQYGGDKLRHVAGIGPTQ